MLVVVVYDIINDKRLSKISKLCSKYGQRVQNSVFECQIDYSQFLQFKAKLKKIGITLIVILIVIIMCAVAWHIPAVKNALIELYYNNMIFKIIADIFLTIFNMITGIFKK